MIENLCYKTVICFFLLIILVVQAPVFAGVISTKDDLKKFVIIGVHPFNWMDNNKGQWNHIFSKYNIQFLDRNTSLNDVDFRIELDSWHVAFANENHIPDASCFSFHPQKASTLIIIDPLMLINTDPLRKCLIARAIARFLTNQLILKPFILNCIFTS